MNFKFGYKSSILLQAIGICIISFGLNTGHRLIEYTGMFITSIGLTSIGIRVYESIQKKARQKSITQ